MKTSNYKALGEKYPKLILDVLTNSSEPLDVEAIRRTAGIGNWGTALSHCLELLYFGKIRGQKASNGWTFWMHTSNEA